MLSKNNYQERLRKMDDKQERFSIRKFSVGAASVLVGTAILSMQNVQTVRADATTDTEKGTTDVTSKNDEQNKQKAYNQVVSEDQNKASKTTDTTMVGQDSKVASFSASKNEGTFAEASSEDKTSSTTDAQKVESKVATAKATTDTANSVKTASTTSTDQTTSVNTTTFNTNQSSTAALFSASALSESKALAATPRASSATTNAQAKNNNYKLVTSSSELQQAINSGVAGINIDRSIDASNVNLAITNTFAIVGINDAAVLNLGQKSLNNSGNLTLQDITINGAVSGNGTVNIKGNVTSNVNENNSLIKGATADAANAALKDQTSTGTIGTQGTSCASGSSNQNGWTVKGWNYANFSGSKVNVAADANLTINRSAIGDGIHLANNGTVNVADGGQLTINMNTNNDLNTTARYHNAGIFAVGNGNFTTGYKSVVTLNTSIGQGIAMTGMRPYVTDTDVFGGYSARDRGDGSGQINLGQYSTLNFTGRDGVILGNNSNFNVGDSANVHFENKGRGVALDLAANSNINIDDHAVTYFHSVGKTTTNALGNTVGASGSFSGYNYIGVNEGGNITVGKFATFRVILEGRGNNNYDDVVSLDSQNTNTNAAFTSKTGAIVDIRDDNTNFYAELISFPLGASNTRIDIHDPLMLNLQRYSSGGPTTGWMPIGGDMINTTSNQYTANLIYMSGSKGVFSVDGTNYVVYQKIKSDGSKQIWLNVNGVNIPMSGFQTKDIWDNQANPDVSIKGNDLTSGIRANQVHNYDGTPLTGKDAPYYGISTQRASQQIWFPHKTQMEVVGSHTNTIKYVYEDGTPVLDENGNQIVKTQNLNLTRKLTLDITDDKIEEIQKYALTHNADQTLEYIKNAQGVSEDSGWVYTDAQGNTVTDPYATVVSPVEDGQTASIESSNVPGITEGADGTSVTAKLQYKEELVQNGELSNNYKQNGLSAILPDNYETVVVYKKAKEVTNTLKFYDDTTKSYISTVADQTATGKENDDVNFKDGASTVKSLEDQGYKFINVTDGTPDDTNATVLSGDTFSDVDFGKFGKDGKTFVVHLTHKVVPVTPDTPNVPSNSKVSKDDLTKTATRTIHYVENDQNGAELKESTVQTVNYTGTAYVDVVTGQMVNAKADGKDAQGNTTYVVDTDNKKQPSITWTTDNNGKFAQVTPDASIKKGDDTWTTGVKSVDEKNAPDVSTITGKTTNEDVYVPYTLSQKTYTGTKETKTVTRVINYLDNETKQPVSDAVEQTTTLSRTQIKDEKGNVIGYGTVSEDGHSYTLNNDWTIDKNGWVAQVSPDETAKGYKETPHFEDGKDASTVAADTPSVTDPQDVTVNVFYDHDTTPVTPDKPGHGLTHDDLNKDVTRTINYVDTTGAAVNGAPDGKSTYTQTAHFTRTAIVDKVNDKLLGYDINGDGSVDISPDAGDFAWKSTDANLPAVTSKAPSEVGYDSVDTPVVQATTVAYNSEPINVTVTYSKNAQQGSFQIHYIDEDNNNAILHQDTVSDKIGDSVTYSTADQIQLWESKGYVLDQDGYTTQTTVNEDNNGKTYIVSFKHGRKNGTTETLVPTETIHFQYADGTKAADDVHGNAGDFKFTRTPIIDTVTGQIVDPGTWNKESYTFDDGQKNVKVINGYVADKATYGNKTATPTDLNVEDTVTYRKISNIIPVDENGNQIPGTTPVDYKNDPSDPTKVTPDEESPKVPSGWTISPNQPEGVTPNTTTNTAKVTPVDPTKPTNVVYTKDNAPVDKATVIVRYHDDTTNLDLPESFDSGNKEVGTDTGYTQADINKVVQEYEAKGYYYVTTDGTLPTTIPAGGATIVVHLAHNQIPVGPDTPDKHGVDPDQVKKAYTSTLHYQDSEGKTLSPDQQQTSTWTRTVTVDTVTNQIVNGGKYDTNWTLQDANDKYSNFTVPVVEGYVARKTTNNGATVTTVVAGQTKVQQNLEDTVVYDKVGKLVPVGPDGKTPIPDAPTPSYPNDPTDPTKVIPNEPVPDVPGYTPVDPTPITPEDPTKDTPVPYTKDPVKAGLTVQYIDQDNNNSVIKSDAVDGNIGDKIDYSTASSITDFENKGYILVTDGFTGQAGDEFTTENNGQVYKVVFKHGTRPVTPENPADPNEPVDPDHPDTPTPSNPNLSKEDLQKTITRTIEYKYADGTQAHEPVKQELTFTGKGTIDLVTGNLVTVDEDGNITSQNGKITWNHESQEFEAVPAIDHDGYYISSINQSNSTASVDGQTGAVGTETVTPNSQNGNIVITLTRNPDVPVAAQGSINYIDDTTGQTIESANFSGNVGQKINYTTAGSIKNWEAKGYNLVSNNFKDGEEVFTDGKNAFEVHLVHATTPVTPENPGKPGEPVNPTNPDDPHKYPDNYVPQELAKTVTRDVTYVYADGSQAEAPVHQEVKFTGNGYLDLVTGEYVTVDNNGKITGKGQINWTPESANFDATKSIDTSKYQIVGIKENNTTANVDQTTGVVAGETVTQNSNNSSVVITLANKPAPVVEKGSITVKVHDLTDNVDLPQYGKESGEQEVGTSFTYDKNAVITELINKGYKLVDGGENVPSEVAKGAKTITILVEHDTVPVTPENPGKPGEPINPNDPDGPKWPEGTDENSVKRTGTQTIHYEGAGDKTPSDDVQTFDFTKKMLVDKVTGKIIDSGEWNVTSHTFGYKDTPVIDGYHADKRNAGGSVVTPNDLNKKVVVTYKPNGKIIPTDPSGNPIPNVPTPTYPTDPTDPTKVVPDEPVPDIPGMTPSTPTVTPEDPGKDTPVPYNPVVPAKNQVAQVIYRDVQDGANKQLATSGDLTGKSGSEISYSTADQIKKLINQGYVLKNDGFPAGAVFDNDDSKNQVFYVDFIHGQAPVNPDNPHEGIDPSQYEKTVTEKVHYVGAGDKTPADNVQNSKWTRTLTIDTVTGKVVENGQYTTDWSIAKGEKTVYDQVSTPVIDGYHADKREVPATAVTQDDIEVTVTYKPNGKIIPTDPSSNPIPNVPNPTYPTDPTDPTKVVPDQPVPEVPGMTPSTPTVTPEDPGKDTPVPYNPVKNPDKVTTVEGKQIVHFVDGDNGNTPLRDPNTQTHEFKITNGVPDESSHTFTLVDVPVIPGYVAEVKSAGGKTVTPDTPLAEVTVVYHKVGKIVPVDPNGNPIPNVPTPSYTNDPTDPTKVVPNEPVPAITGKTPDKTSVTPVDPTKDTPVVYKNNEVPATPNSQKAVVNFIDVNTGKLIKTSGILSGRPGEDINKLYSSAEVIKQLEEAGYEVVYNAFDGDGVTKYFDDDDNTTQQFTVALKLKEKAKTPYPVVPAPETPAKEPEAPAEKVSRPEQPVKQNVSVPTPQKPVEKKTNNKKEVLPQTGADNNEAASILGAVATAIGMTSLIGAKRRKKDDK
ncbi:YSIRK-type signal peptide-containing protein [Lactobacillus gasseri]|uniref:mucin-binding protein n=2 Tax=Lactobacillus gasseri TaxID=1596 RepID=UPI000C7BB663|nr:YSIRK-type signal peptide-containing protein [Lactobacillus gasseri]MCZ3484491.1 YSIRK-type signal peptide-containing protein [Lactobacillus gasseri]MCZ3485733.1 YSIRK-type signal peptide-containing protein [Lactobacillus gasseri]MCZ3492536.1 YSIRK-type signal peptide-containing protein [Lactobacillus gasseri]MCZ3510197.1 YSIRK-type signal peptide-containing protein [Lactobacillus gasseri]MCZ3995321.1 YSIRK-type signal peptide-containing protein [Lactobacillus gasseri]